MDWKERGGRGAGSKAISMFLVFRFNQVVCVVRVGAARGRCFDMARFFRVFQISGPCSWWGDGKAWWSVCRVPWETRHACSARVLLPRECRRRGTGYHPTPTPHRLPWTWSHSFQPQHTNRLPIYPFALCAQLGARRRDLRGDGGLPLLPQARVPRLHPGAAALPAAAEAAHADDHARRARRRPQQRHPRELLRLPVPGQRALGGLHAGGRVSPSEICFMFVLVFLCISPGCLGMSAVSEEMPLLSLSTPSCLSVFPFFVSLIDLTVSVP